MAYFGENLGVKGLAYGCHVHCMLIIKLNPTLIPFSFAVMFGVFFLSKPRLARSEKELKHVMWIFCLV